MEVMHDRYSNTLKFRNPDSYDYLSPASQDVIRRWGRPLWPGTFESRCPYPVWERFDPLRAVTYSEAARIRWGSPQVTFPAATIAPSGRLALDYAKRIITYQPPDRELYAHDAQELFALFCQFDILSVEQIHAFTSISVERIREICQMFVLTGILKRPEEMWRHERLEMYRMDMYTHSTKAYEAGMDAIAQLTTTGGQGIGRPPMSSSIPAVTRHNLFAAEMALRLAESGDNIAGFWGEPFLSENLFHEQNPEAKSRTSQGDFAMVTKDGSIVIFELTTAVKETAGSFRRMMLKAASWVGVIANSPLDISVIFLVGTWRRQKRSTMNAIKLGTTIESRAFAPDNHTRRKAMSHIGVVPGPWWFPEDGVISEAATRMTAWCPANFEFREFDVPDPGFSTPELRRNVVINTASALHTPRWIRNDIIERPIRG